MTGRMQYLIGSGRELARVWQAWGVGSERDLQQPQFINHTGLVYGVTASGKRLTVYASSFQPSEIAHDVPELAELERPQMPRRLRRARLDAGTRRGARRGGGPRPGLLAHRKRARGAGVAARIALRWPP